MTTTLPAWAAGLKVVPLVAGREKSGTGWSNMGMPLCRVVWAIVGNSSWPGQALRRAFAKLSAMQKICACFALVIALSGCGQAWNDPYPAADAGRNILYTAFTDRPKHLDPAQSYAEDEAAFTAQIYEPPLHYHYLKRPYQLVPATVEAVPVPRYLDAQGRELPHDAPAERIAESVYELKLKPGIRYQPHPAFAPESYGQAENLAKIEISRARSIADFSHTGTRELTADDYIYQIKRLAHPRLHSPIFGMMADKIVGLKELGEALGKAAKDLPADAWLDLDAYRLAMPFFAPVPREVDRFFAQPGMAAKNLSLDWWPVGTGPFMLSENDPNRRMVLSRNPNFHGQTYPCEGEAGDREAGLLDECGKPLPFSGR